MKLRAYTYSRGTDLNLTFFLIRGKPHVEKADHLYRGRNAEQIQYLTETLAHASDSVPSMKARFNN